MPASSLSCRGCGKKFSTKVKKQSGRNLCERCYAAQQRERKTTPEYMAAHRDRGLRRYREHKDEMDAVSKAYYEANKESLQEYAKEYREKNRDKIAAQRKARQAESTVVARRYYWVTKYGLTVEQAEAMLKKQRYVCAICKQPNKNGKHLAVDHCHKTGKVRGFLCSPCNIALGGFRDDPELLRRAARYISANIRAQT